MNFLRSHNYQHSDMCYYLFQVHYDWYNNKYGDNGFHEKLDFADVEEKVEEFRRNHIFPMLIKAEKEEKSYPLSNRLILL